VKPLALTLLLAAAASAADPMSSVEHLYAQNGDVKLHYAALGQGPLVVMIHGFPDYWYTWRNQMPALAQASHRVAAIDLRGYNMSDKPKGVEQYAMPLLVGDIAAVVKAEGRESAVIVGHDWGAAIAWQVAMHLPAMVEKLVILNVPHPRGLSRELAANGQQTENSAYAREFQKPGAHQTLTAENLTFWVKDEEARKLYVEAFEKSDFEAMMSYYKANYPTPPYQAVESTPPITCPTLVIHGMKDKYLLAAGHSGTWDWIDNELTMVMLPEADHFVQHDAAKKVTRAIVDWLK
jgi:pimeloyl-ACP methyl ester carboxylesterase